MVEEEKYLSIAREHFGISYLRPYQELIIKHLFEYKEGDRKSRILGCLPTGGGKSLCFMLPILLGISITIVIYPLNSLLNDQKERFSKAGIPLEIIKGGMKREERTKAIERLENGTSLALLTNIEMLTYLVDSNALSSLKGKIAMVVLDEVHTVITWGNTFRPAYKETNRILSYLNPQHIIAFTATMNNETMEKIVNTIFNGEIPYLVRDSSNRENIFYWSITSLNKIAEIRKILKDSSYRPAIIFCPYRRLSEELSQILSDEFETKYYHAGIDVDEKREIEEWFSKTTDGVLATTIAFGMGVDIKGIRSVIHYSLPKDASSFLQESGRGGRDGKNSFSFILSYPEEESPIKSIFTQNGCIRYGLLKAMNEDTREYSCLGCNHCIKTHYIRAGETEILRYIKRHPFVPKEKTAMALSSKTLLLRRKRLPTWSKNDISRAIDILISEKKLKLILKKYIIINKKGLH